MMTTCRIDFETRSDVDLKRRGAAIYFASPHWKALMAAYRIGDGPMRTWTYVAPMPADLREHVETGGLIRAWNASFERQVFDEMAKRCGWARPTITQYRCTAAEAAAMSLPRSLEDAGDALGLPVRKDKEGKRLIDKFSVPRRARAGDPPGILWNEPEDHPEDFAKFLAYCVRDVETEEAAAARIVPLSDDEQAVYALDQIINDRGIRIDLRSARAAVGLAEKAKAALDRSMRLVTGGAVGRCTEVSKLVAWVQEQGVEMTSAQKAELTDLLDTDDLPARVREALELRQEAAKTSVSKLNSMIDRAGADGRARGAFLYHGAGTGRFQSVGVNFGNMPRVRKIYEDAKVDTRVLFDAFRAAEPSLLTDWYGPELGRPLHLVSDAVRGFLWAAPGHDFVQADYTSIEGAVIAWSSGEDWKVQAMNEIFVDPSIPDLYRQTAARIMNTTTDVVTKKHPYRQSVGKVSELALGFGGGVAAFVSMSKNYAVKLDPLFAPVWETASEEAREKAVKRHAAAVKRGKEQADVLSREAWIACELIKTGWRAANPAIAAGWRLREQAVREAVQSPGAITRALKCSYIVANGFLWARLPSGRCLAYGAPKLTDQVWAAVKLDDGTWTDDEVMDRFEAEKLERAGECKISGATSPRISALGTDAKTKRWTRRPLYGGLLAENDTQAIARDILVHGMQQAEAEGYPIVLHVYDEMVAEVPRGFGSVAEFEQIICRKPEWAEGLPLAASGWRGKRYRKD